MPKNFANQPVFWNGAKMTAIGTLGVCADDKNFPGFMINIFYLFNHCTVDWMFEYNDIPRFECTQNDGESSGNYVISIIVFRCKAIASYFYEFEHQIHMVNNKKPGISSDKRILTRSSLLISGGFQF